MRAARPHPAGGILGAAYNGVDLRPDVRQQELRQEQADADAAADAAAAAAGGATDPQEVARAQEAKKRADAAVQRFHAARKMTRFDMVQRQNREQVVSMKMEISRWPVMQFVTMLEGLC